MIIANASSAKFTLETRDPQGLEATVQSGPLSGFSLMIHEKIVPIKLNFLSDCCRFVLCFAPLRQLKEILD